MAKLDFAFAKAKLSIDMNGVTPKINKKGYVFIKEGRHPLLDKNKVLFLSLNDRHFLG